MENLTIESITEAVMACRRMMSPGDRPDLFETPRRIYGLDIIEAPARFEPKIKLGDSAPVSDEFRASFDAWPVGMFGMRDVSLVPLDKMYVFDNKIMMRRESIVRLSNC